MWRATTIRPLDRLPEHDGHMGTKQEPRHATARFISGSRIFLPVAVKTRRREMRCLIFVTVQKNGSLASTISIVRKKRDYVKKPHNQIQRTRSHATHTDTSLPPPRDTDQIKTTGPLCLCTGEGEKITTIVLDSPRRRQIIFVSRPRKESSSSSGQKTSADEIKPPP